MTDSRLLGGRYQLAEPLGYGGMAEVFLGRDIRLGRDVAVKVLRADLARDPSFLSRFRREAQSAASLNHPNIVGVYDTGDQDGTPYIVMEYLAGRTLREVIAEDGRLLPRRALEIISEVCEALEYSHRGGIVHRDIKPANVMLTRTGEVKVMDFGIARAASASSAAMTQTAQVLGTAAYISPEQARGEHVDARSDVYSAGCVLYELLTGVPPFQGDSPVAVAYQHVREDPIPPSSLDPDLPASLDAVVLKAMAKNPANRYQSAAEFRADVDRAAAGRRVEATPILAGAAAATVAFPVSSSSTVLLRADRDDHSRRRAAAYTVLALAVIVVFIAAAILAKGLFSKSTGSLNTPQLVGDTLAQARQALAADGLRVGAVTMTPVGQDNNNQAAGRVYNQSPLDGFTIKPGSAVDLFVSSGILHEKVPMVVGLQLSDARALLARSELPVSTITQENVAGTAGTVISVSPPVGTTVDAGSPVTLTVVSGMQLVPDVLNEQLAQAAQNLQAAGFQVYSQQLPNMAPAGTVIAENPNGGTSQNNGATITLTVSSGPATSSSSPSPSPTPTGSATGSPTGTPTPTTPPPTTKTP